MVESVEESHVFLGGAEQRFPYKEIFVRAYVDRELIPIEQARDEYSMKELQS